MNKGDTVKIMATSSPVSHRHGITIDDFNVNEEVKAGSTAAAQEITFTVDKTGTFQIYCKTCRDGPLGEHPRMKLNLVVQ